MLSLCHTYSSLSPGALKQQLHQTGSHQRQEEAFSSSVSTEVNVNFDITRLVPNSRSRASPEQAWTVSLWMFHCISVTGSSSQPSHPFPKRLQCEARFLPHLLDLSIPPILSACSLPGHGKPSLTGLRELFS